MSEIGKRFCGKRLVTLLIDIVTTETQKKLSKNFEYGALTVMYKHGHNLSGQVRSGQVRAEKSRAWAN